MLLEDELGERVVVDDRRLHVAGAAGKVNLLPKRLPVSSGVGWSSTGLVALLPPTS